MVTQQPHNPIVGGAPSTNHKIYRKLFFTINTTDHKYSLELYNLSTQALHWNASHLNSTNCTQLLGIVEKNLICTADDLSANFISNLTNIIREIRPSDIDVQQKIVQGKIDSLFKLSTVPSYRARSCAISDAGSGFSGYLSDRVWSFRVTGTLDTPASLSKLKFVSKQRQHLELVSYFYENPHLYSKSLYSLSRNEMIELYFKPKVKQTAKTQYTLVPEIAMNFKSEILINMQKDLLTHTFIDSEDTGFDSYISEKYQTLPFKNRIYSMSSGGLHSRNIREITCRKSQGFKFGILDLKAAYPTALVYLSKCSTLLDGTSFKTCELQFNQLLQDRLNAKEGDWIQGKKLILNSIIGNFKYKKSAIYEPHLNVNITTFVQLLLLKTIELIYETIDNAEFRLVFANTDGIGLLYYSEDAWKSIQQVLNAFVSEYGMAYTYETHDFLYFRNINNYFTNTAFKGAYTSPSRECFKSTMSPRILMNNLVGYMEHVEYQESALIEDYIFLRNNKLYVYVDGSDVEFTSSCSLESVDKRYYRVIYEEERQRMDTAGSNPDKVDPAPVTIISMEKYLNSSSIGRFNLVSTKFLYENYQNRIRLLDTFGHYFSGDILSKYNLKSTCKSIPNSRVCGISLYADQHMYIVDIDEPASLPPRLVDILEHCQTLVSIKQRKVVKYHPSQRTRWFFFSQRAITNVNNTNNKLYGFEILWNKAGRVIGNLSVKDASSIQYFCNNRLISNNVELELYLSELGVLNYTGDIRQNLKAHPLTTVEVRQIKYFLEKTMGIKTPITEKQGQLFTECPGSDLHTNKTKSLMSTYKNDKGDIKFCCFHTSCNDKLKHISKLFFLYKKLLKT